MSSSDPKTKRRPSEAALEAARAAKAVKRAEPDTFGHPELFIVSAGAQTFTWELRRFGGVVLQRGAEAFPDASSARADGEAALAAIRALPGQQTFKRASRA